MCLSVSKSYRISQTNLTDRVHNLSVNAPTTFSDIVLFSRQLRQTVSNNSSTWAASRLYTSAPGALHLGQEALCCLFPAPDLHEAGRLSLIAQKGHEAWNSVKLFYINHWDRVTVWQEYRFIPQSRHSAKKSTPPK